MAGEDGVRRGRPRNVARRRVIVRAALAAYARGGYEGATMHEIAAASGIGDSLLYRYYASKQALFAGVVAYVLDEAGELQARLRDAAATAPSLAAFLRAAAKLLVAYFDELGDWYAVRFTGLPIEDADLDGLRAAYDGAMDVLSAGVRARTPCRDASIVARVLIGSLFTYQLFRARAGYEPRTAALRQTFVDEVVEVLLDAVAGHAGKGAP